MAVSANNVLNILFAIFFLMAALVQFNDPDPVLWVSLYIIPAITSTSVLIKPAMKVSRILTTTISILQTTCVALVIFLTSTLWDLYKSQKNSKITTEFLKVLDIEEGRELGGTLLVLFWTATFRLKCNDHRNNWLLIAILLAPIFLWGICYVDWLSSQVSYCSAIKSCKHKV